MISDFGRAGSLDLPSRATSGSIMVDYSPPEIVLEDVRDSRADVFSLGVVYSEMATIISGETVPSFEEFRYTKSAFVPDEMTSDFASSTPKVEIWLIHRQIASAQLVVKMMSRKTVDRSWIDETIF